MERSFRIKLLAKDIIKKYDIEHPIDMHNFANSLGFNIKYVDTGSSDAYTIMANGKKIILISSSCNSQARINFTIAHELGHYFIPEHLEQLYECKVSDFIDDFKLNDINIEKEADLFASELLLPSDLIKKHASIDSLNSIVKIAETYKVSIPVAAIKTVKKTDEVVCFIYFENNLIKWFVASPMFKEYVKLKDIMKTKIPKASTVNNCVLNNKPFNKDSAPAYLWLDDVDDDMIVYEETIYYPEYNSGYIMINADELVDYE